MCFVRRASGCFNIKHKMSDTCFAIFARPYASLHKKIRSPLAIRESYFTNPLKVSVFGWELLHWLAGVTNSEQIRFVLRFDWLKMLIRRYFTQSKKSLLHFLVSECVLDRLSTFNKFSITPILSLITCRILYAFKKLKKSTDIHLL